MIKVLIVDDHPIVRSGIRQILSKTKDIIVQDEAENASQMKEKIQKSDFDLVILDISLPDNTGLELIKDIKNLLPDLPILIHTMHPEDQLAICALKAGASGYLNKAGDTNQVVTAIRKIIAGKKYISEKMSEKLAVSFDKKQDKMPHEMLSEREYEVMLLIVKGITIKEIGNILKLSPKTVSTYHARILEKMDIQNDAELINYSIQNKLIDF